MRLSRCLRGTLALLLLLGTTFGHAAETQVNQQGGAGADAHADGQGVEAHAAPTGGRAYVDPGVVAAFEVDLTQVVILVLDPTLEGSVLSRLAALGLEHHLYDQLHMVAAVLPRDHLADLEGLPGVLTIYRNEKMQPLLDASAEYVGAKTVWTLYGVTGRGVTILVVDSGVDGTHPDVRYGENLIENVVPVQQAGGLVGGSKEGVLASDADGHGTHVAGIVGGTGKSLAGIESGRYRGIAHGARLIGFQAGVTDPRTDEVSFESVTVLEAFNYAIANRDRYRISVVTNSWGTNGEFDPKSPINVATLNLYKAGMVVVFAAGNEGANGLHTLNKYAVAPWVLAVAAGDYLNQIPSFSSRGSDPEASGLPFDHPDVVAPGAGITSARAAAGGVASLADRGSASGLYVTKSGTSMATPHVAGIAALLLEANPRLSPDDVYDILTATATPMPRYDAWEAGAGFVNALHAFQLAKKAPGSRDAFVSGKVKYAGPASGDPDYARDPVTVGYQKGAAVALQEPDKSFHEFAGELVGTIHGIVFLIGTLALGGLAFGWGRRRAPRRVPAAPRS